MCTALPNRYHGEKFKIMGHRQGTKLPGRVLLEFTETRHRGSLSRAQGRSRVRKEAELLRVTLPAQGLRAQQPEVRTLGHVSPGLRAVSPSENEASTTVRRRQAWSQWAQTDSVISTNPRRLIYNEVGRVMAILQNEETENQKETCLRSW